MACKHIIHGRKRKMDWKTVLSTVAPWIGTAMAGPFGGMAVRAAADALGLDDATEEALTTAMYGTTSADMLALKKADQEFQVRMQELGFKQIADLAKLETDDRANARQREVQVKDNTNKLLACAVCCIWALVNVLVILYDVPAGSEQLIARLLGTLDAALMCILYYYFGGSRGSDRKTEIMVDLAKDKK